MEKPVFDPNNRVVMYRNEKEICDRQQSAKKFSEMLTEILEAFRALGIGELSLRDLARLVDASSLEEFTRDFMLKGKDLTVEHAGLKFSFAGMKDMFEIPDLSALKSVLEKHSFRMRYVQGHFHLFSIVDGKVKTTQQALEDMERQCSLYADCPEELEFYTLLSAAAEILHEARAKFGQFELGPVFTMRDGKLVADGHAIKTRVKKGNYHL